ncbi:MAG: hypothetical protein MI920_04170 [Kiloniellales bacterium]|nr:hypothetical protein [Kiloniellales bacterium]
MAKNGGVPYDFCHVLAACCALDSMLSGGLGFSSRRPFAPRRRSRFGNHLPLCSDRPLNVWLVLSLPEASDTGLQRSFSSPLAARGSAKAMIDEAKEARQRAITRAFNIAEVLFPISLGMVTLTIFAALARGLGT